MPVRASPLLELRSQALTTTSLGCLWATMAAISHVAVQLDYQATWI